MTTVIHRPTAPASLPGWALGGLAWAAFAILAAGSAGLMGLWAVMLPVYAAGLIAVFWKPRHAAAILLFLAITFESAPVDFSNPLAVAIWAMPPGFENALGVTTSPMEVLTYLLAAVVLIRVPAREPLPLVAWAVPGVILLGLAYGSLKGGPSNLAYNEARGLLTGIAVVIIAMRLLPRDPSALARPVLWGVSLLAITIVLRYVLYVRTGRLDVPAEFAFSHESSVLLGVGLVVGVLALVRPGLSLGQRLVLAVYCLVALAAMVASGRRAATLVLVVGAATTAFLLFPRRPVLVVVAAIPMLMVGAVYLAAYWNTEYGAAAQPARAIRSQFDPTLRDESSDQYRTIEKHNVIQTIRVNRPFGVGFGRPFYEFQPLPHLGDFWPLQKFTPHQNVLWLWLKMGILGIAVFLGFAAAALSRCLEVTRRGLYDADWELAAAAFSVILMFLMYTTVDLGFIGSRSVLPAALACAVAFSFKRPQVQP